MSNRSSENSAVLGTPSGSTYSMNSDATYEGILLGLADSSPPEIPLLTSPAENAFVSTSPTFQWDQAEWVPAARWVFADLTNMLCF